MIEIWVSDLILGIKIKNLGIKKLGLGLWLQMIIGHLDKRLRLGIRIVGLELEIVIELWD